MVSYADVRGGAAAGDGSDFMFRQRVDDRYKEMAKMRKRIKTSSVVTLGYIFARTLWRLTPSLLAGAPVAMTDVAIFAAGVGLYYFYRWAFGYGKTQHEKLWAIMTTTILYMLLLAECFLTFWIYHVYFGPKSHYEDIAATYPPIPKTIIAAAGLKGGAAATMLNILDPVEKLIDVVGLGAIVVVVVVMREYALDSRDHKREQAARKGEGTKTE